MAEIQLARIKSIYGDLKGLLSQIPSVDVRDVVNEFVVNNFNETLDNLSLISGSDYSNCKIPTEQRGVFLPDEYNSTIVRTQIGRVVSRLEQEYGFDKDDNTDKSLSIAIFNKNQNEISLQINYTLNGLIESTNEKEEKRRLKELDNELNKPNKDWDKIKPILIWAINFSKDLFLKLLPIILQNKP